MLKGIPFIIRKQNTYFCCCCCFCNCILFDEGSGVDTGSLLYPVFAHKGISIDIIHRFQICPKLYKGCLGQRSRKEK